MSQHPKIEITRTKRKSLSMRFDNDGVLQVRAPRFILEYQIQSFLKKNTPWIDREYKKILERQQGGGEYYLFGEKIPSDHIHSLSPLPRRDGGGIKRKTTDITHPGIPSLRYKGRRRNKQSPSEEIHTFYKTQAKEYIIPRTAELAQKHGFTYTAIKITSAKTRWGSCTSKKHLNFSYRLVMTPKECIDYVIIHELCHLRQMNHSAKFWKEVANIMPTYKQAEKHLKKYSYRYKI